MEALTALGLASNVVQFISFARELVSATNSISRSADGALVENLEIEAIARNIQGLSDALKVPPPKGNQTYSEEEKALKQLCEGCKYVAGQLIEKIQGLKVDTRFSGKAGRKWASFRQALNSALAADDIEDLGARLDRYQKTINTILLASIRAQVNEAERNRATRDANMSSQLLGFIDETKVWQANLIDTIHRKNWQPDRVQDVEMFSHQLVNGAQLDRESLNRRRIHHLLQFEEIGDRQETIAEAHKRTFEWVFHQGRPPIRAQNVPGNSEEAQPAPQWDNFLEWLTGPQDLYWITGKPGSGKSTLMKYLFNHERTLEAASQWSKHNQLVMAGFFFWNSGTTMQMSRMGLVQTLLYQILRGRESLIPHLFPHRWSQYTLFGGDMRPWSWMELTSALKAVVSIKQFSFLLFIDGLDEFDGNAQDLVSLLLDLRKISPATIKLCVASRPWLVFEESFRDMPWLRMEDLTRHDIQLYVEENMKESRRWNDLQGFMPEEASKIIEEITDRAVGVFLWVILVVASLLSGLRDGDNIEDLWRRVNELPSTLEELFQKILGDLNPRYFAQGCEMFQLAFTAFDPLSLLDMSLALDGYTAAINAPVGQITPEELTFRGETMRRRIISRSKGLLEVPTASVLHERARVEYLHRTVRDFFKSEQAWAYIRSGAPKFDPSLMLSASFLRQVKMTGKRNRASTWDDFWRSFVYSIEYLRVRKEGDQSVPVQILNALGEAGDVYWSQEANLFKRYGNWLDELVDGSTTRANKMDWVNKVSQCPVKKADPQPEHTSNMWARSAQSRRETPHWTNTIHLAELNTINVPHSLQAETHRLLLRSYFDLAYVLRFDAYISAAVTPQIARRSFVGDYPLLVRTVLDHNYALASQLVSLGADPNMQSSRTGTIWGHILKLARNTKNDAEKQKLRELAATFVSHGADVGALTVEDLDDLFVDMEYAERDAMKAKIYASRHTRPSHNRSSSNPPSLSVRKAMKQRLSAIFKP